MRSEFTRQKSQNSIRTGRPRCLSIRSDATLIHAISRGNGGAGIVSGWARTGGHGSIAPRLGTHPEEERVDLWSRLADVRSSLERSRPSLLPALEPRRALRATSSRSTPASTATPSSRSPRRPTAPRTRPRPRARRARRPRRRGGRPRRAVGRLRRGRGRRRRRDRRARDGRVRRRVGGRGARPARPPRGAVRDRVGPAGDLAREGGGPARPLRLRRRAGTAYFDLHAERDVEHAADGRALIAERLDGADEDALVAEAERVLRANWTLLDGVERLCAD